MHKNEKILLDQAASVVAFALQFVPEACQNLRMAQKKEELILEISYMEIMLI